MKKIFTVLVAGLMISAQAFAVTTKDVCGQFNGELWIDWDSYGSKSVYLLPGTTENTLTFVLPDFSFLGGKLGNIVLPNISMDADGKLSLKETSLYLDSINLRASIKMLNNYEDEGETYNSIVSATQAQITLEIAEPKTLPMPIIVIFEGQALRSNNYALPNGGFEGQWVNNEPAAWHSFASATGEFVNFVKGNTQQFVASNDVRPGSEGTQSILLSSNILFGVKANGNCTNGQINAGSMTADNPANYNFSDPKNAGFNTPFQGRPDSIAFWAKYLPADKNPNNEVNKARMSTIITTNARYQDPEAADYSEVKVATATINYAATADLGWQRIAVPFTYTGIAGEPAYILTTFTTNHVPGGGSSEKGKLDSVYIDDVELIYNKTLKSFSIGENALQFNQRVATVNEEFCDSCADYVAAAEGKTAQTFIGFDAAHKCIHVYVIADDFAQSGDYRLYRVEFSDSQTDDLDPLNQGVENLLLNTISSEKVLLNGQLFIRRGDVWFNAAGIRVK
jgi:hypothetical protein